MEGQKRRAVFIDRDGTIVKNFSGRPANTVDEIELLPKVSAGFRRLAKTGLLTVVVSNQGGIGLGYMTAITMHQMNDRVNDLLAIGGAPKIDAFYFCPHKPHDFCACRKPRPGMFLQAAEDLNIDLERSYMVGDDVRDMDAAVTAGISKRLMVVSDMYQDTPMALMHFPRFYDAAKAICIMEAYSR